MSETRFRDYILVINNWTEQEFQMLKLECEKKSTYAIIGKEVGESGTPHLQSFIYWSNQREFSAIKKKFPRAHIERKSKKSTFKEASDYCKKDGDFWEHGELPLDRSVNNWESIDADIKGGMSWEELSSKYPEESIKYVGGLRGHYETHRPKYKYSLPEPLRPFQEEILEYIKRPVNDTSILWIFDVVGNAGKSKLAGHLLSNCGFIVFGNGKTSDIAYAWNGENVVMDYSRSQQEHINYGVLEDLKNGRIFSPKYQSATKFYKPIHLMVFANFMPDKSKMSLHKWDIRIMTQLYTLKQEDDYIA